VLCVSTASISLHPPSTPRLAYSLADPSRSPLERVLCPLARPIAPPIALRLLHHLAAAFGAPTPLPTSQLPPLPRAANSASQAPGAAIQRNAPANHDEGPFVSPAARLAGPLPLSAILAPACAVSLSAACAPQAGPSAGGVSLSLGEATFDGGAPAHAPASDTGAVTGRFSFGGYTGDEADDPALVALAQLFPCDADAVTIAPAIHHLPPPPAGAEVTAPQQQQPQLVGAPCDRHEALPIPRLLARSRVLAPRPPRSPVPSSSAQPPSSPAAPAPAAEVPLCRLVEVPPPHVALLGWDKLQLAPVGGTPKDVAYFVLCPRSHFLHAAAVPFFRELAAAYELMQLGTHRSFAGWSGRGGGGDACTMRVFSRCGGGGMPYSRRESRAR